MAESAEATVLEYLQKYNRPQNANGLADALQSTGVKKAQVGKALESLVNSGKIGWVDNGKQRVYVPKQHGLQVLDEKALNELEEECKQKEGYAKGLNDEVARLQKEASAWEGAKTVEQLNEEAATMERECDEMSKEAEALRHSAERVSTEERQNVERAALAMYDEWVRRRRMFKEVWDGFMENVDMKESDVKEDAGLEWESDHAFDRPLHRSRVDAVRSRSKSLAPSKPRKAIKPTPS